MKPIFGVTRLTLCIISYFIGSTETISDNLLVKTANGWIKGKTIPASGNKTANAFLGIPFAKPPVGDLRFKYPQPADSWDGVLDCTKKAYGCPQIKIPSIFKQFPLFKTIFGNFETKEDCLHLNVFTPSKPKSNLLPVIVHIYGGGFFMGFAGFPVYDGQYLVTEEDVILVNVNYRLSSMGFFYLDHPDVDGNAALADQSMAMRWVRDNIDQFGGDPNQVTLMGQSAGAISIGMHLVSPMSRGLFHRAIMQSGDAYQTNLIINPKVATARSLKLAEYVGCPDLNNFTSVIECLRKEHYDTLIENEPHKDYNVFTFLPTIDGTFVKKHPKILFNEKKNVMKIDLLAGLVKDEGTLFMAMTAPASFGKLQDEIFPRWEDFELLIEANDETESDVLKHSLMFHYTDFHNYDDSQAVLRSCKRLSGDYGFNCGVVKTANIFAQMGVNVYTYLYDYLSAAIIGIPKWFGVFHGADVALSFGHYLGDDLNYTQTDRLFNRRFMRYWMNFARTGNPNKSPEDENKEDWIEWPRHTPKLGEYLVLAPNVTSVGIKYRDKACQFWYKLIHHISE